MQVLKENNSVAAMMMTLTMAKKVDSNIYCFFCVVARHLRVSHLF